MTSIAGSGRAIFSVGAKAAVSALAIFLLISRVSVSGVRTSLAASSALTLALAFATCLVTMGLGGLRWWLALRGLGERTRATRLTMLFSAAALMGQVMPSVAADGLRVWLAVRGGLGVRAAAHSVLLERVFMVLAVLTLALLTAPMLAARTGYDAPVWLSLALLACGLAGIMVLLVADRAPPRLARLPFWQILAERSDTTRGLVGSRWGASLAGISVLANLNFALGAFLISRALRLPVTALDLLAIMPFVTLATTLPFSLGGWGVREGVFVVLLGRLGVPANDALSLSIVFGVFGMVSGLPGFLALVFGWTGVRQTMAGPLLVHVAQPGPSSAAAR